MKNIVPAFFAVDDAYVPMLHVVLTSLIKNSNPENQYNLHILNEGLTKEHEKSVKAFECDHIKIFLENITDITDNRAKTLEAEHFGRATFYRAFIPNLFPQYDKVLYIDSDLVINADIADMYSYDLGENLIGGCVEQIMKEFQQLKDYSSRYAGVHFSKYFNAGVIIMNTKAMRKINLEEKFFEVYKKARSEVDPDQVILNYLCRGKVTWLPNVWNKSPLAAPFEPAEECKIIHFVLSSKPWANKKIQYDEVFWEYAKGTKYEDKLHAIKSTVTDESLAKMGERVMTIINLAGELSKGKSISQKLKRNASRIEIVERIKEYEAKGLFDLDVENDPETKPINHKKLDYHRKKISSKIKTKIAYAIGYGWYKAQVKRGDLVVGDVVGLENLKDFQEGALVTCNHIHQTDNFVVLFGLREHFPDLKKFRLHKVVREGNYSQPGALGFIFRHADTLPVNEREKQNLKLTAKTMIAIKELLAMKKRVLIYPEQAMWWNYRKPRPLKNGAFMIAAKNMAPIIPCFITMKDTDKVDGEGFPIQEYTLNILPIIYPDKGKDVRENTDMMREKNFALWKELYEKTYGIKLEY